MVRLTSSNTITYYTAMSNNAEFDALANELLALRQADGAASRTSGESVLVARLVPGFNVNRWQEFLRRYPTGRWCALPAGPGLLPEIGGGLHNAPGHLAHLLMAEMFVAQISRELLRLSRTGGDLAVIEVALCERAELESRLDQPTMLALEALLVDCLRQCREECDTLGCTGPGRFALLLPGVSVLRARLMAEQMQKVFSVRAAEISVGSGKGRHTLKARCAMGIACADQGARPTPEDLLVKTAQATDEALAQKVGHICISGGTALEARTTLVHSSEKRFLFFGGN